MRLKRKFAIAIIILLLIVTAGTSVYATEFKSRILSNRNISLGDGTGSSDYTIGTPNKTTIAKGYTFKERNKGSIILHSDKIIKSEGLYCIQPDIKMGYETHYSIDKDDPSEHKYTNDLGAYILTESDSNTQGYESLADSPVQQAIWTWYNYSVSTDSDLYNCAQKFDEYRKNYVEPSANTSAANGFKYGNGYAYGPLELSYVSTKWEGTNFSRSFGEITAIEGVDANGNSVSIQVLDKDKSAMNGFPESDTSIYLLATGSDALPISVKICFNEVEAEGSYQQIQGYYNKSVAEISTDIDDYCDECKKKIGSNEVDEEGYVYQVKTKKTGCGKYVNDTDSGNTGKKLKSHFSGYCGITVKNLPTRMNVSSGVESGSQSAKCGDSYRIQGYYMVGSTEHNAATITRTACCGRSNTKTVEYYDYITKVGCGKTIHTGLTYEDKTGKEHEITTKCGIKYVPSTEIQWIKSQKILQRWGERSTSRGELSIEFDCGQKVRIKKLDKKTRQAIAGAELKLYDNQGKLVDAWTTTTSYSEFQLKDGEYTLVETEPPEGYNFAENITFTVAGQDIEIEMLDSPIVDKSAVTGDLSLRKYIVEVDGNSVNKNPLIDMLPLAGSYGITGLGGRIEEVEGEIKEGLVPIDEPKNALKIDSITLNTQQSISNDKLGDWSHADSGEWYYYDDNGNAITGWQKIENDWFYFNDSGVMLTGWQKIDEVWYHFGSDGRMDTGWLLYKKRWYYLNNGQESSRRKGAMLVGKYEIAPDEWYYFDPDTSNNDVRLGIMLKGWQTIDGLNYYFCNEENEFEGFKEGQMLMGRHIMSDINGVGQEDKTPYIKHIYFNKIHPNYPKGVALLTSTSTADYNHSKEPNKVHISTHVNPSSVITYKISVYNEGPDVDMRALEIADYKSNYLEFIEDDEINTQYGWTANGNVLTTTALKDTTIPKCNDLSLPSSASVLLRLRVKDNVPWNYTMVNVAEISKYGDADGNDISDQKLPDIDSSAGNFSSNLKSNDGYRGNGTRGGSYVQGQEDDDDFDVVITGYPEEYIDLSLRKYITGITDKSGNAVTMTTNEGTQQVGNSRMPSINITGLPSNYGMNSSIHTATYTHKKDPIDVCAGDLVTYTITVYNEYFELDAYAVEITDYIPDGLEFVPNHPTNAIWKAEGNVIKTDALSGTLLAKYDGSTLSSASVEVVLRVKDSSYLTTFRNIAEITNYGADVFGTQVTGLPHDRDSIPNNVKTQAYNPPEDNSSYQEDDDDYEELRLTMMDMGGRLWKDGNEGKTNGTDGLIDPFETGFKNHKVTLSGGESREVRTYNDAGNYFIGRVYINRDYVLAFEYEGQEYISTTQTGFGAEKSAGRENASDRGALNAKFYEVVKDTARNSNKQNTVGLRYATEELSAHNQTSTLIRDEQFNNQTLINAVTPSFSGVEAFANGYNMNINQGAKLRTQSALALTSDVDSVDLTINGDRLKYDYSKANDMVSVTINGQPTDKLQRDDGELVDITLKEQDFERVYTQAVYESDYNFRIEDYKDYTGDKIDPTKKESRELEAYITYRLKVRNNSSKVTGTSELKIYYDNYAFEYFNKVFDPYNGKIQDIKNKNSWYVAYKSNSDGTKTVASEGGLDWENALGGSFNGYDAIKTKDESGLKNALLNPNDEIWIYIRFQIKKHDEGNIKRKITSGNRYIVGEISGYTTPEGLIDYYSQPNNIDLTNPWGSYKAEYDTTRAPGINIVSKPVNRSMSGFVFEDARTKTISANDPNMAGIVTGDGQYNTAQGDKKMNDVIVQLIEQVDIDGKHYEYIWQETTTGDPNGTVKYMDKDGTLHNDHGLDPQNDIHNDKKVRNEGNFGEGNYKFTHFVPGNYIVRFIYGDIVKNQRVVLSGQDYKYTTYNDNFADNTSNAKDNPVRRDIAMKFSKDGIDYRMSRILQNIGIETELLRQNTWINADTKNMEVRIGDIGLGHGVNFGIVERPKSNLKINKEISAVKVSNKGIIIIDTENGKGKPIQAPFKETFQEIDDELINGANLEVKYKITVSNEGELDTLYNYFEGNSAYGSNQGKHITTSAELVYDYPEKIGFDPGSNTNWDTENINLDIVWDQVKSNIEARLKAGTGLVVKSENKELNKNLIPVSSNQSGDKTVSTEIILKRVLALGQIDGFLFNNMTEIIRAKNEVGRKDAINTYGNYIPFSNDINKPNDPAPETDASYAQALVTSNAGLPYNPHYEIWLISAVMLAVGIILIKIFVVPRNKKNKEK